jgi:hypothetical protein
MINGQIIIMVINQKVYMVITILDTLVHMLMVLNPAVSLSLMLRQGYRTVCQSKTSHQMLQK